MFKIIHLVPTADGTIHSSGTDYEPGTIEQIESIVRELNSDAIESSSPSRWISVAI